MQAFAVRLLATRPPTIIVYDIVFTGDRVDGQSPFPHLPMIEVAQKAFSYLSTAALLPVPGYKGHFFSHSLVTVSLSFVSQSPP